jgi:hypothetical protein
MQGELIRDAIDVNDAGVVERVLLAAQNTLALPSSWHRLMVRGSYYFSTPDGSLPTTPGWYFICDEAGVALYVGEAEDLNARLNSSNGSLDNFANTRRTQDSARNFLKRFVQIGLVRALRVGVVEEDRVTCAVPVSAPLSKLDRCNVEKVFGLFRQRLLAPPAVRAV